ncbi:MAG: alpha-glucosidase [Myxococcota bacterium]|jgi:alpha-glucosidase
MRSLGLGVLLGLSGCHHRVDPTPNTQGGMLSTELYWALDESALRFTTSGGREVLALPLRRAFLTAAQAASAPQAQMGSYKMKEKVERLCDHASITELSTALGSLTVRGELSGKDCDSDYTLTVTPLPDGGGLTLEAVATGDGVNRLAMTFNARLGERMLGLGEQFTESEHKGRVVPMLTEEQGIGRGAQPITAAANLTAGAGGGRHTTYLPVPFLMTTEHRSLALDGTAYSTFDLSDRLHVTVSQWRPDISATLRWADGPRPLLAAYTEETGRMQPLPDWAHRTILGVQGGRTRVDTILDEATEAGNPIGAVWVQDWVGKRQTSFGSQLWWRWQPEALDYPDLKGWSEELAERDVRLLGYINPFLATEGAMYEDALAKGILIKKPNGDVYTIETAGFPAVMLDLSSPAAEAWIKEVIKTQLLGNGMSGWMADFGEWLPMDARLASGESAEEWHNRYPVEWARINREAVAEAGREGDVLVFFRSGYTGSAAHAVAFWEGDQMVDWDGRDGLGSAIVGLTSGGLSGLAINHSDIGGYTTISRFPIRINRSEELLMRWAEMGAFTPIFRTHEGNLPGDNHQFYSSPESQAHFAAMGTLHAALGPLLNALEIEASQTGLPVVRHPYLVAPNDPETVGLDHQFFVGDDLLVLPVWKKKDTEVKGYFPAGQWEHIWTGERITGPGTFRIEAPLGKPAAFIRAGGPQSEAIKAALAPVTGR